MPLPAFTKNIDLDALWRKRTKNTPEEHYDWFNDLYYDALSCIKKEVVRGAGWVKYQCSRNDYYLDTRFNEIVDEEGNTTNHEAVRAKALELIALADLAEAAQRAEQKGETVTKGSGGKEAEE